MNPIRQAQGAPININTPVARKTPKSELLKLLEKPGTAQQPPQLYGPQLVVGAPVERKEPKSEFLKRLERKTKSLPVVKIEREAQC